MRGGRAGGATCERGLRHAGVRKLQRTVLGACASGFALVSLGAEAQWTAGAPLAEAREAHSASLIDDGHVLVFGGQVRGALPLGTAEIYEVATGSWAPTTPAPMPLFSHRAHILPSGRVLMTLVHDALLHDPATAAWSIVSYPGLGANTETQLVSGAILLVGGNRHAVGPTDAAVLHDPEAGTTVATGRMTAARMRHTAVRLASGQVLVVGGQAAPTLAVSNTAEIFDPSTGTWSATGTTAVTHVGHTLTLLLDGRVLLTGGYTGSASIRATAEIFDPATGVWREVEPPSAGRVGHTATLLGSGRVLVAGGVRTRSGTASAELFDPISETWATLEPMLIDRAGHTATVLPDSRVLLVGGVVGSATTAAVELFDEHELRGCASTADCDDGDACTIDECRPAGICVRAAVDCDDGDVCTLDVCGTDGVCSSTPTGTMPSCRDAGRAPDASAASDASTLVAVDVGPSPTDAGSPPTDAAIAAVRDGAAIDAADSPPPVRAAGCGCRVSRTDAAGRWCLMLTVAGAAIHAGCRRRSATRRSLRSPS